MKCILHLLGSFRSQSRQPVQADTAEQQSPWLGFENSSHIDIANIIFTSVSFIFM